MSAHKLSPLAKHVLSRLQEAELDADVVDAIVRLIGAAERHRDHEHRDQELDDLKAKEDEVTADFYANYQEPPERTGPGVFGVYIENYEEEDKAAAKAAAEKAAKAAAK